jgi:hypothetical protein
MTGVGPTSERSSTPQEAPLEETQSAPTPSSAAQRAARMNAANMLRSLLPLVVICLIVVGWTALRQAPDERVQTVDPASTVQLAVARASYPVQAPTGLPSGFRVTSARTDAGNATKGAHVTLEIGYLTPKNEYAGFAESDDPQATELRTALDGAQPKGTVDVAGASWNRLRTTRGETALSRTVGTVTLVVTGSASDAELTEIVGSVRPHSG